MERKQKIRQSHRDLVLKQACASVRAGRVVVPIPAGQKGPALKNWPLLRITEEQLPKYFAADDNLGCLTGKVSGNLCDVDLDCPEAVYLGQVFLPQTERIHGREGSPRSHHWYICEPLPKPKKFTDLDGGSIAEIRADGQQTLIPPSVHPCGERLKWYGRGEPSPVSAATLQAAVAKVAAGALLAKNYPAEGQRHDFANALSGMLVRAGVSEKDTAALVKAVAETAGDEEAPNRASGVATTLRRIAVGGPSTGLPTLASMVGDRSFLGFKLFWGSDRTQRQ